MITLETARLLLRPLTLNDFDEVHSYASDPENVKYMIWGPNDENATQTFLKDCETKWKAQPLKDYEFAIVLKDTGRVIGACGIYLKDEKSTAMLGWILHHDFWKQGFMPEAAKKLLEYCFDILKLHRVFATCNTENYGSFRVMEKIGMRREAHFIQCRFGRVCDKEEWYDEFHYAILDTEWVTNKEIAYYTKLPCVFNEFIDVPVLTDGNIQLVCMAKKPAVPEKKYVPSYDFAICKGSKRIGEINLRIGYSGFGPDLSSLYYGGQIGYSIDENYRGNGYAMAACKLVLPVAKAHSMKKLLITNDVCNIASRRVCEKLGLRHVRRVRLPEWTDLYAEGQRYLNIYEMDVQ